MTTPHNSPVASNNYSQGFGTASSASVLPVVSTISPASTNIVGPNGPFAIGQKWINTVANSEYVLTSLSSSGGVVSATWTVNGATSTLATLTGDSGGAISPNAGNITLAGTAEQITSAGSGSTITFSLIGPYTPASYTAHGVLLGEGTSSIVAISPDATSGIPLISKGSSTDPAYGTAVVAGGGTGATTLTSNGVLLGNGTSAVSATAAGTNGQLLIGGTSAAPAFAAPTSTTGIAFTTGSNTLAINTTGWGNKATAVSGASQTGATQSTYICSDSAQTTVSLPSTSAIGDSLIVIGTSANTGGLLISQASGQEIFQTTNHSTSGTMGSISTGAANTSLLLVCIVANTTWNLVSNQGSVTFT